MEHGVRADWDVSAPEPESGDAADLGAQPTDAA